MPKPESPNMQQPIIANTTAIVARGWWDEEVMKYYINIAKHSEKLCFCYNNIKIPCIVKEVYQWKEIIFLNWMCQIIF